MDLDLKYKLYYAVEMEDAKDFGTAVEKIYEEYKEGQLLHT